MKITVKQLKQLIKEQVEEMRAGREEEHSHTKGDGSWWENDARGIPLCRVCDECRKQKLSKYRPEILSGYDQSDVNEPIDPNY